MASSGVWMAHPSTKWPLCVLRCMKQPTPACHTSSLRSPAWGGEEDTVWETWEQSRM